MPAPYNYDIIKCRGPYKHAWDDYNPSQDEISDTIRACWKRIFLRCTRCTATRHDGIDINGDLIYRKYKRPDGYKIQIKGEKPTAAQLRLIVVKRRSK